MNHFLTSFHEYYHRAAPMTGGSDAGDQGIEQLLRSKPLLDERPDKQKPVAADVALALEDCVSLIVADVFASLRSQVNWALGAVESPIEGMFFLSVLCLAARNHMTVEYREKDYTDVARLFAPVSGGEVGVLRVNVQPTIGDYRVDFLLQYSRVSEAGGNEPTAGSPRPAFASFAEGSAHLVVECDGHEFHERTKEQAEADKARDRTLQTVGFPVFRYTGSRLTRDPFACARECLAALVSRATGEDSADATYLI